MKPRSDLEAARRVLALEQAALQQLADGLDDSFVRAIDLVLDAKGRTICVGIGKSGHIARKIAATLASTGTPAYFVHPAEASHGDLGMIAPGDVVLALSRSGETAELSDLIHFTRRFAISLIGMTARQDSTLARTADVLLLIPDAPEACGETNAPTTSTTLMIALGDALAVALLERRGFRSEQFKIFHPGGKLGAMLRTAADLMHHGDGVPLAPASAPLLEAVEVMSAKGLGIVGLTDSQGHLAGVLTDGDLRRHVVRGGKASTVSEVMTRRPYCATPDTLAAALLRDMNDRKIMQVFVVDDGMPVGVVHMHDLLKAGLA
jgi:arabinose-5-phosphate isomerase